jgi:hypothetical protein
MEQEWAIGPETIKYCSDITRYHQISGVGQRKYENTHNIIYSRHGIIFLRRGQDSGR